MYCEVLIKSSKVFDNIRLLSGKMIELLAAVTCQ